MGQILDRFKGKKWRRQQVRKIANKAFDRLKTQTDSSNLTFEDLYISVLVIYNDINKYLPGPHFDPPSKELVRFMMEISISKPNAPPVFLGHYFCQRFLLYPFPFGLLPTNSHKSVSFISHHFTCPTHFRALTAICEAGLSQSGYRQPPLSLPATWVIRAVVDLLMMEYYECVDTQWFAGKLLVKYQYLSDFFIAFAYFSVPLELIYFVKKSAFFPYRWVLIQFGAFIVPCGATHLLRLWTFSMHAKTVAVVMTIAKLSTAAVSCVTALMLFHIIPDLLSVKTRELILKRRVDELDREMGLILAQEETGRHVRMLTHEIRSTMDQQTILKTTLVELGRTLGLEECSLWMPSEMGMTLWLSHALRNIIPAGSTVSLNLPVVAEIFNSPGVVRIPHTCPLVKTQAVVGRQYAAPEVVAVRVPLLNLSNFQTNDWPDVSGKSYAVMVLVLPSDGVRKFREHELELIEVVADQVVVALSHAAIFEESMRARDQLLEQNIALDLARREAEMAIRARSDFLAVMNHEMRTPMHAIISLSSLLLETELTPQQRVMIETILKSSNVLSTLINDVLDLSRLEDGSLELESAIFNLHAAFVQLIGSIKPISSVKKLYLTLAIAPEVPVYSIGDEKRLMQTLLNIVGNALKFSKVGGVSVVASVARPDSFRGWRPADIYSAANDGHFYLRVQVKDTGCGISSQELPLVFDKFSQLQNGGRGNPGVGLGLAICKRFVNLMGGHIWIESEGFDKGTLVSFIVKLGICRNPEEPFIQLGSSKLRRARSL